MKTQERLKALRVELGYTQKEIAEKLAMRVSSYNQIEVGRNNLSPRVALLLEKLFMANTAWIYEGEGDMFISLPPDEDKRRIAELEEELRIQKEVIKRLVNTKKVSPG